MSKKKKETKQVEKKKCKYYAIKEGKGVKDLIVRSWDECKEYVHGYSAVYKSFTSEEDAKEYLENVDIKKVKEQAKYCSEHKEELKEKKKKIRESVKTLNIKISAEMYNELEKKSKETKLRVEDLVKFALSNYLY